MKKITLFYFLTLIVLLSPVALNASGKDNYNKGWVEFTNNNREEARKYFTLATEDAATKADAFLSLSLLNWSEGKLDAAYTSFRSFYESSDNPYPYLYAFYSSPFMYSGRSYLEPQKLSFLEKIIDDPKMNGTLKAMISQALGEHYQVTNNPKKSEAHFSAIGAVSNWQVLGSFDNISGSGFSKDWGAVAKAKANDVFKDKVDAEVRWYTPSYSRTDRWFDLNYYFVLQNTIIYTQSFVNSPSDREVYIRVGTSGSLKIWINDEQIASIPEERNCDMDIYIYKVKLNAGYNRVLLQLGQSEINSSNFLFRFTDENGNPLKDLSNVADYQDYKKVSSPSSYQPMPLFAEEYLESAIKQDPSNYINYFALGETYLRNDKAQDGIRILKEVSRMAPKSSVVHFRLGEAYLRDKNQTNYTREMENIKLNDPESFSALQELFSEAMDAEKLSEAQNICNKVKSLYGESRVTEGWDIQLASQQKQADDVIVLARKLYAKYPYDSEYMELNYLIEDNIFKNNKAALAIVEAYCKKYFHSGAMGILSETYFKQGNTTKGLKVLEDRIDRMPYATGLIFSYANLLRSMQKYDEALKATDKILALAPYLTGTYNSKGYIYKEMQNKEKAIENFKKAIYYAPSSYDSRTQLRILENKKEVFDLFPKYSLDSLIAAAPAAKDYPEDHSLIILNDNQLVYYPEGATEYHYEIAIKIFNQTGIETWKEYGVGYNGSQKLFLDKAEVIKANGQKVKAESNGGHVVFTNLEVGDVLHLDYRIQDYATGILSKHFSDQLIFQYDMPSMINRYSVLAPEDKDFKYIVSNGSIEPVVTNVEDMKLYQWISDGREAVKVEPYMSPFIDVVPTLTFSSIPDWKFVSDWYRDITTNKIKFDYVFEETYAEILKGKENAKPLEKAKLFYEYILQNITYSNVSFMQSNFIPQKASRTISTRLGDCKDVSTLFVTFCRRAGIKANLVLIATRDNGNNLLPLPQVNFNHCIAQLEVDGKTYYLELTDNKLPFGAALEVDLQSPILPIPYDKEPPVNKILAMDMPFRDPNAVSRTLDVSFSGNDMNMKSTSVRQGSFASYMRQYYADLGEVEQLKQINQSIASDFNTPAKATNLSFVNLNNLNDTLYSIYDVEVKNAFQEVAGMKIFKLPWNDKITSLEEVSLNERKYTFELWQYFSADYREEQINLVLPEGKKFVELPKDVKLECANAVYEMTFDTNVKGKIVAKRKFTRKTELVSPEQYEEFKNFMYAVSENDNKQYAIN
jgi:tetratricopeptide (TPR) repeat protein